MRKTFLYENILFIREENLTPGYCLVELVFNQLVILYCFLYSFKLFAGTLVISIFKSHL